MVDDSRMGEADVVTVGIDQGATNAQPRITSAAVLMRDHRGSGCRPSHFHGDDRGWRTLS